VEVSVRLPSGTNLALQFRSCLKESWANAQFTEGPIFIDGVQINKYYLKPKIIPMGAQQ